MVMSITIGKSNSVFLGKTLTFDIALDQDALTLLTGCGSPDGVTDLSFSGLGGPSSVTVNR